MAIEVLSEVMTARRAPWKAGDLIVLMMLAGHAHPDGTKIFPRVATLARSCRMQDRNVQLCLRALELDGVLIRVSTSNGAPGRFNEYRIDMERVQSLQGCKICRGVICDDNGCNGIPIRVQNPVAYIDKRPLNDLETTYAPATAPVGNLAAVASEQTGADPLLILWHAVRARLRLSLKPGEYTHWIEPLTFVAVDAREAILQAPNPTLRSWAANNYRTKIERAFALAGRPVEMVTIVLGTDKAMASRRSA